MKIIHQRIVVILLACFLHCSIHAQTNPLWGSLKSGPYKIGFKSTWYNDYTRTWGQSNDIKETYSSVKPFGRPVRISVWYPAAISSNEKNMKFRDYVFIKSNDPISELGQQMVLANDIGDASKSIKGLFKGNDQAVQNLLNKNVPVYKNSKPVQKKFPLIIYSLGQGDYTQENTVLFEYLASNGYIVASVPQLSVNPRIDYLVMDDPLAFDTQLRDLEFTLGKMIEAPNVDHNRVGAMGMSMGSVYTYMLAAKNPNIHTLIGLDGTIMGGFASFGYKYWQAPYVDSGNIKIPVLQLFRNDHHDMSRMNSMIYADRYLVTVDGLTHTDFTSYPLYTASAPDDILDTFALHRRTTAYAFDMHQKVCNYVLKFLDATLKQNSTAINFIQSLQNNFKENNVSAEFLKGVHALNEEEFVKIILHKGTDAAIAQYNNFHQIYPSTTWLRQRKLNRIGYEMVYKNDIKKALQIFLFNAAAFPNVAGVYSSLADGYEMNGQKDLAIINYKKVLDINPTDETAKNGIERLTKTK
ncbi:MAG: hypothetical protein ABIY51_06280 [Ferruginibacter sp.]